MMRAREMCPVRRGECAPGARAGVGQQLGAAPQPAGVGGALPAHGLERGAAPRRRRRRLARAARRRRGRAGTWLYYLVAWTNIEMWLSMS